MSSKEIENVPFIGTVSGPVVSGTGVLAFGGGAYAVAQSGGNLFKDAHLTLHKGTRILGHLVP